jgi:cytochrome b561
MTPERSPAAMPTAYTPAARFLHWATAALLLLLFGLGVSMTRWVPDEQKIRVYSWHEWVGLTVFALTAIRLMWTLTHPAPPLTLGAGERIARRIVHGGIYAVLLTQPIVGWIMSCAFGFPVVYLGLVPLPIVVDADPELAARMQRLHDLLALALVGLFALHLGAIANHHLFRRDGIMRRMLPPRAVS